MDAATAKQNVIQACLTVGDFIRKEGLAFDRSRIEFKEGFNNLVSYVDKEAEHMLVDALRKIMPEAGFITEEGTASTHDQLEYNWIIDPLDGTTNFLHGLPPFAISVALAHKDQTVLGVVYEVNRDECFHAHQGGGAFCNTNRIHVSPIDTLGESLLATGFPYYHSDKMESYLTIIRTFLNKTHGIRRLGSAAVDLAYVACGRLEGFFEYNLNPWDVAAGAFIVQEAGGKVTDFKGENNFLFGGELIAAGPIHPHMQQIIREHWPAYADR
jgi:myo-inositol-1(or 4)-monophosphatase